MGIFENKSTGRTSASGSIVLDTVEKWGENVDVSTADALLGQVIWPIKAATQLYLFLDSAIQLYLTSTSAADDISGTGAQKVGVSYNTDTEGKSEILDMAGVANVPLPDLSTGAFRLGLKQTGAGNKNAGQIQIVDGSANIYATIEIGEGQSQIAVQQIPPNRKGRIRAHKTDYARTSAAINDATMRLRVRKADGTILTKWDPTIGSNKPNDEKAYLAGPEVGPGEWVYWECITVSANVTPLRGSFDIDLEAL